MKNSFENIPKDTQTQIFYVLPLSPFACFSTNKWISFSFFLSRFSCEYWTFVATVSWYQLFLNQAFDIRIGVPLLKNEHNSSLATEEARMPFMSVRSTFAAPDAKELSKSAA